MLFYFGECDIRLYELLVQKIISTSCKPQAAHAILNEPGLKEALEGKLLISILAGVTIKQLSAMVSSQTKVVRAMPNTPCKVSHACIVQAYTNSTSRV